MRKERFDNLNSRNRKFWDKLVNSNPVRSDIHYGDFQALMAGLGFQEYNKGKTSGSRVKFYCPETGEIVMLHKPHPGDVMSKAAVRSVRDKLREFYENAT